MNDANLKGMKSVSEAKDAVSEALDNGKESLEKRVEALRKEFEDIKETGKEWFNKENIKQNLDRYVEGVSDKCTKSKEMVCNGIAEKPMQSVLVMAGIGFVLGLIVSSNINKD